MFIADFFLVQCLECLSSQTQNVAAPLTVRELVKGFFEVGVLMFRKKSTKS